MDIYSRKKKSSGVAAPELIIGILSGLLPVYSLAYVVVEIKKNRRTDKKCDGFFAIHKISLQFLKNYVILNQYILILSGGIFKWLKIIKKWLLP